MLLRQMLYRCEIRFLPIAAGFWLSLNSTPNYEELIRMLCGKMLDRNELQKFLSSPIGKESVPALNQLIQSGGQVASEEFENSNGPLRLVGINRILREKLWLNPISLTEKLWFRGLIFREPRSIDGELKDCYILPNDLLSILETIVQKNQPAGNAVKKLLVRPAVPSETVSVKPLSNNLPDHICLAAALRRDKREIIFPNTDFSPQYMNFIQMLVDEVFFNSGNEDADTEAVRSFMTQNRTAARIQLVHFWRNSEKYEELNESNDIHIVEKPVYSAKSIRESIIQMISDLPVSTWLSIHGLLSAIKKYDHAFLRKHFHDERGIIQDSYGNDLSGIGSWFQLEGAYIRFLLLGPFQWLGLVQIAYADKPQTEPASFLITEEGQFLLQESSHKELSQEILDKPNLEQAVPVISGDGAIGCSTKVPRYFRYMAVRYCEIENVKADNAALRITPASLANAESRNLKRTNFLALLKRFTKDKVPPALVRMLSETSTTSIPATIYSATILTVPNSSILRELSENPHLGKWLLQQINPTSLLIDPKGIAEIRRFLMEHELFVDVKV